MWLPTQLPPDSGAARGERPSQRQRQAIVLIPELSFLSRSIQKCYQVLPGDVAALGSEAPAASGAGDSAGRMKQRSEHLCSCLGPQLVSPERSHQAAQSLCQSSPPVRPAACPGALLPRIPLPSVPHPPSFCPPVPALGLFLHLLSPFFIWRGSDGLTGRLDCPPDMGCLPIRSAFPSSSVRRDSPSQWCREEEP